MESLLANYASSDEEEQEQPQIPSPAFPSKPTPEHRGEPTSSKTSSLFSSLPQPKSSSLFQSLPPPKQTPNPAKGLIDEDDSEPRAGRFPKPSSFFSSLPQPSSINPSSASPLTVSNDTDGDEVDTLENSKFRGRTSLFSSLPKPKSQIEQESASRVSSSGPTTKKVVQFRPPVIPLTKSSKLDDDDEDDEDDREEENRRKKLESMPQTPSVQSFLSSIPAPRNTATLGVQTTSGSGRRSILEADAPASNAGGSTAENNFNADQNAGKYANDESFGNNQYGTDQNQGYYMDGYSYGNYSSGIDHSLGAPPEAVIASSGAPTSYYVNNDAYASYNTYGDYEQHGNNWADGSGATALEMSGVSDNGVKVSGKRGRNEIPSEVIEVKQEELIKNRPREDQVKLTGIAFGPAYQVLLACVFSLFSCQDIFFFRVKCHCRFCQNLLYGFANYDNVKLTNNGASCFVAALVSL